MCIKGSSSATVSWVIVALFLAAAVSNCGVESHQEMNTHYWNDPLPEYLSEHIEMEPVAYTLCETEYTSGRTRIWYSKMG